jgi:hypothetical protein
MHTLLLTNVSSQIAESELYDIFETYGEIRMVWTDHKHKGVVLVEYCDLRSSVQARAHLKYKMARVKVEGGANPGGGGHNSRVNVGFCCPVRTTAASAMAQPPHGWVEISTDQPVFADDVAQMVARRFGEMRFLRNDGIKDGLRDTKFKAQYWNSIEAQKAVNELQGIHVNMGKMGGPVKIRMATQPLPVKLLDQSRSLSALLMNQGQDGLSMGMGGDAGSSNMGGFNSGGGRGDAISSTAPHGGAHAHHGEDHSAVQGWGVDMHDPHHGGGRGTPAHSHGGDRDHYNSQGGMNDPLQAGWASQQDSQYGMDYDSRQNHVNMYQQAGGGWQPPMHGGMGAMVSGGGRNNYKNNDGNPNNSFGGYSNQGGGGSHPYPNAGGQRGGVFQGGGGHHPNMRGGGGGGGRDGNPRGGGGGGRRHAADHQQSNNNGGGDMDFKLDLDKVIQGRDNRTTLMIRNIPNKYSQRVLLEEINHNHMGRYDFFYLPIDFKNKCNVGYAFINFMDAMAIVSFSNEFNQQRWKNFNSEKVCALSYARIQGKAAMIARFQNSSLMDKDDEYQPLIFKSDGEDKGMPEPFPIGKARHTGGS